LRQSVASVLRDKSEERTTGGGYALVLEQVRQALRARRFEDAERELMRAGTITDNDPAFLNLAGILHECHGRLKSAQHFYEKSAALDPNYRAAGENLRRLTDLRRHGHTERKVAFGDGDLLEPDFSRAPAAPLNTGAAL
jgi:Flp pilus assembly protein TadD